MTHQPNTNPYDNQPAPMFGVLIGVLLAVLLWTAVFWLVAVVAARAEQLTPDRDISLTPGVVNPVVTKHKACTTAWGKDARHVTASMKRQTFIEYGFQAGNKDRRCPCEVDHLVPREIGGADALGNLMIQSYRGSCNAHDKDRLENAVHQEICAGTRSLADGQAAFMSDWKRAYRTEFGEGCGR